MRALPILVLLLVSCSSGNVPTQATQAARPTPTATSVRLDYNALRGELMIPLSTIIVVMRDGGNYLPYVADFETAAKRIEPMIAMDMSINGNRLHSAIVNTREAVSRKDVTTLEKVRRDLLEVK